MGFINGGIMGNGFPAPKPGNGSATIGAAAAAPSKLFSPMTGGVFSVLVLDFFSFSAYR